MSCVWVLQRGHSGDGCYFASTLCKYDLRKGYLLVLSWARARRSSRLCSTSQFLRCCCVPTPMTLANGGGESNLPNCGPPASFSVHPANSVLTPAGSVHKSRGHNVVHMDVSVTKGA